jgi:sulfur-oxidizing protein SoxX
MQHPGRRSGGGGVRDVRRRRPVVVAAIAALTVSVAAGRAAAQAPAVAPYTVVGDAIPEPLTDLTGDPARGRAIVLNRQVGLCLLCHTGPFPEERFQGNLAPDLGGAGTRWSVGQLRLRIVDGRRLNPQSLMPAYHRVDGLERVGSNWKNKPVLAAQQIEDVVAFLATLRP